MVNILFGLRARRQLDIIHFPLSSSLFAPFDVVVIWVVISEPLIGVAKLVDIDFEWRSESGLLPKDLGRTWTKGISWGNVGNEDMNFETFCRKLQMCPT